MTGKTLIQKNLGSCFWPFDMKEKNAHSKKHSMAKAEGKRASRKIRRDNSWKNDIN